MFLQDMHKLSSSNKQAVMGPSRIKGPGPALAPGCRGFRSASRVAFARPEVKSRALPELQDKKAAPSSAPSSSPAPGPAPPPAPKPKRHVDNPPSGAEVVVDKAFNAVSDVYRHLQRLASTKPTSSAVDRMVRGAEGRFQLRRQGGRPVVLVLGSGWAAHSCIKVIDTEMYDVVVVSPRNFFCFTPMLPSTAVGTIEFRSLLEPIRTSNEFVGYLEACCDNLDLENKVITCTAAPTSVEGVQPTFELPYDILVVAVGEQAATFGVPGVQEHCFFMKEVTDTQAIRNKIGSCFELATLPGTTDEDRRRLLHFVVVGGGPTGVEFAGTLSDYVRSDLKRKYPQLISYVKVSLLQSAQGILTQFDSKLAKLAMDNLNRTGVEVRTGVRVVEVTETEVLLKGGERLDHGLCVWSCGNAARPLVQDLVAKLPEQAQYQRGNPLLSKLAVDGYQRVVGARDVVALGDCSYVVEEALPATAQVAAQQGAFLAHIINRGFIIGRGGLDEPPPCKPEPRCPVLSPLQQLVSKVGQKQEPAAAAAGAAAGAGVLEGGYEERSAAVQDPAPGVQLKYCRRKFQFFSLGIMAYVGDNKALTQIDAGEGSLTLYGGFAYLLWRSVYITKQVSLRNRVLILFDWLKAQVFGRDLSMF